MLYESAIRPFIPSEFQVKLAQTDWERDGHHALRRQIFCSEQGIFTDDDRDRIDTACLPIVALSCIAGNPDQVVGVVRIHQPEPGLWWGSRLGVHADFRRVSSIGAQLVRLAVCTAAARGCDVFLAHVQSQNVRFFEHLNWRSEGELLLHGRPHHLMRADLEFYKPHGCDQLAFLRPQRQERLAA